MQLEVSQLIVFMGTVFLFIDAKRNANFVFMCYIANHIDNVKLAAAAA
jgi:hypothetical protein